MVPLKKWAADALKHAKGSSPSVALCGREQVEIAAKPEDVTCQRCAVRKDIAYEAEQR